MVRHLEEGAESTMNRDADIDAKNIDLLINRYIPSIVHEIEAGKYDRIVVISSDKSRSQQTTEILKDELAKQVEVPIEQEVDPRTSAENHGAYKEGVKTDDPLINRAKRIYLQETFEKGDVWYRYGSDTDGSGRESYPELSQIFESSGENQIELNIRIYRFILDLLAKIKEDPKTLYILSTHYIVMSRILSLAHIAEKSDPAFSLFYDQHGELYQKENKATEEMIGGWDNFYDYFATNNFVFDVDMSKLEQIRNAIQSDLDLSIAQYMQHYRKEI